MKLNFGQLKNAALKPNCTQAQDNILSLTQSHNQMSYSTMWTMCLLDIIQISQVVEQIYITTTNVPRDLIKYIV